MSFVIRVFRKLPNILTKPTWYNSVFTLLNSAIKYMYYTKQFNLVSVLLAHFEGKEFVQTCELI